MEWEIEDGDCQAIHPNFGGGEYLLAYEKERPDESTVRSYLETTDRPTMPPILKLSEFLFEMKPRDKTLWSQNSKRG